MEKYYITNNICRYFPQGNKIFISRKWKGFYLKSLSFNSSMNSTLEWSMQIYTYMYMCIASQAILIMCNWKMRWKWYGFCSESLYFNILFSNRSANIFPFLGLDPGKLWNVAPNLSIRCILQKLQVELD